MRLSFEPYTLNLRRPFNIAHGVSLTRRNVLVHIDGGIGEAAAVAYLGETAEGITAYVKSFPAGGVDVILALEGFFIGAGMDDEVTLGAACFVKSGAVEFGSYVYDEPTADDDARLVRLGQVPEIPFSETLADLRRIAETSRA